MADTAQLEAELLAALGMSEPAPDNPVPTEESASQPPPQQQPAAETSPETIPIPPGPVPEAAFCFTSSAPSAPPGPLTSAPTQITTATAPGPTATSSVPPPNHPIPETNANGSNSPDLHLSQSLAQALFSSRPDAAIQRPPPAAPVSAPHETPGPRSPKRPRSSDSLDGANIKRQKTDQAAPKQDILMMAAPNLDLAAMLNNALADFDQHTIPEDHDILMQDVDLGPPAAPASTSSELDKVENKIMKASSNPFYVMRSMSLPVLGNIAVQILLRLSQQPLDETETLLSDSDSEFCKAYEMLRDVFRPTRRAFSDSPLLSPDELDITDSEDRETIRMSNLGATAASVFGAHDVSLHDVHDAFFSIFIPEDGEYRSSLTELLVSLKTRLLLDALNKPDQSQPVARLLDTLFPVNFDESLRQRSGDLLLNVDEEGLVSNIRERREQLVKSAADESIKKSLEEQSSTAKFAESLSIFLQGHLGVVVDYAEKYGVNIPLNEEETAPLQDPNSTGQEEHDGFVVLPQPATSHLAHAEEDAGHGKDVLSNGIIPEQLGSADDDSLDLRKLIEESLSSHLPEVKDSSGDQHLSGGLPDFDSKNLASLISEKLKNDLDIPAHGLPNLSASAHPPSLADSNNAALLPQFLAQLNHSHPSPYQPYTQGSAPAPLVGANGELLPPNQSMPTAALYEKARQAAVAKSSNTTRREGLHSTRRPWTPEEEKALMAGLDMVKGPHWSQILSLFGQHGTISDILKDRTQVQLKDKARNLKLFFLKTNSEMPYYLQSVTGELKTRAPGQAARKEAEEKARMNLEEEQARIQGIMTLAGGLQSTHHSVPNTPLAASPSKRTSPATPGFGGAVVGTTAAAHMATSNGTALPAMPIPPRIKTELPDQLSLPKVTAFPPIQPAPAPTMQQARAPLPPLQPQHGAHQPSKPHTPQQYQQPHQQEAQKAPLPLPQKPRQPLPQHQPQAQQQAPSQSQPQSQPQAQQPHHQVQPQPHPPAPTQARPNGLPRPPSAPQASLPQTQPPPRVSPPTAHTQPLPTPPIPPNHHSTPDHAQDTKLFETLQAAIAASNASENHLPLAALVSEGSAN